MTDDRFENPYYNPNPTPVTPEEPVVKEALEPAEVQPGFIENPEATEPQPVFNSTETELQQGPVDVASSQPLNEQPYACEWYKGDASPVNSPSQPPYTQPKVSKERKQKGVSKGLFFAGIAICLCLSFVAGFVGTGLYNYLDSLNTEIRNGLSINKVDAENYNTAYKGSGLSTVEIVNKAADSVVEITTEKVTSGIFTQQYIKSGAGSGVIVDAEGVIVTNHHVIEGASKISVTLRDGTSYEAKLLGSDAKLDVALIEIKPDKELKAVTFGNSDILMVGQRTVAIGNPLGQLGGSVTEGVLSALNRDVVIDGETMSLLQTVTAINPGNSGGGLFDQNGDLIGIVNAKSSGSEVEGLGFAIPINDVVNVIGDLAEVGYVRGRVDLGMTFINVDSQQVAWMYGLDKTGCYIYSVEKNTNADEAGFVSGDRVISVNGIDIKKTEDIDEIIKDMAVGQEITFKVENTSGKTYSISFKLQEYVPETENENFFERENENNDYSNWWSFFN